MGSQMGIGWKYVNDGGFTDASDGCGFTVHVMDVILASIGPREYLLIRRMHLISTFFIDLFPAMPVDDQLFEDTEEEYLDMETTTRIRNYSCFERDLASLSKTLMQIILQIIYSNSIR